MRYNIVLCSIATLVFSLLLCVVPTYAVEVGGEVPPNPSSLSYDDRCEYIVGSTIEYDGRYYASYVASNLEPTYYGSFIAKTASSGSSWLMRTYAFIDVTGRTDYLWQLYVHSLYQTGSMASTSWGSVRSSNYEYKTLLTVDEHIYLVVYSNPSIPDNFDITNVTNFYNDSIEYLSDKNWVSLTDREIFDLCVNFDHPSIIGEYDSSIPCFISGDIAVNQVPTSDSDVTAGSIIGILAPLTNKGVFDSSTYYIDCQLLAVYPTTATLPFYEEIAYTSFSQTKYNVGFDMSIFNSDMLSWCNTTFEGFRSGPRNLKVSCNTVSINYRMRRKDNGNYGDWYSIGLNNCGFNDSSYHVNGDGYSSIATGYSGIVSGSVQTILPTADFDDNLTAQAGTSTNISANGVSLGNSSVGGVVQQGGVLDMITATGETNYDNILSYLGDVPKLMGVVFGYLPPFFISFITTAFILIVTVGLVKMLI